MDKVKKTQVWYGTRAVAASWPPARLLECPRCGTAVADRPFCPQDGTLVTTGPFLIGERYLVEEVLGTGATSFVFGARHELLGKPVAVKVLRQGLSIDPTRAERFLRDARLSSQFQDVHAVAITDFGHDQKSDALYLVMERVFGRTLAQVIGDGTPLPWRRTVAILVQICRALSGAHGQQLLHRNLNPRNVFLTTSSSGRPDFVKLSDFGLSRLFDGDDVAGASAENAAYVAPEQRGGDAEQDERVDLYALGVTAYEMLTGRLPHEPSTPEEPSAGRLTGEAIALRERRPELELPKELEEVVMACLSRDPGGRPRTAAEVERQLLRLEGSASSPQELVGERLGNYRIVELIGTGGMGAVYRAEHSVIGNKAAVKVLKPEVVSMPGAVERFVQEARLSSTIGSEHIPRYYDFGTLASGQPYAVMEYLEGESLDVRRRREGRLSVGETAWLLRQAADALARAHTAGIIHRDIKPDNFFLVAGSDGKPLVKLLDFGIAKVLAPSAGSAKTQVGLILGTPHYAAPEQLIGGTVNEAADIYALGATAFELLSGRPPFPGELPEVVVDKTTRAAPGLETLVPEIAPRVAQDVARMLSRDPAERPASMGEVLEAFESWAGEEGPNADEKTRPHVVGRAESASVRPRDESVSVASSDGDEKQESKRPPLPLPLPLHGNRRVIALVLVAAAATGIVMLSRNSGPSQISASAPVSDRPDSLNPSRTPDNPALAPPPPPPSSAPSPPPSSAPSPPPSSAPSQSPSSASKPTPVATPVMKASPPSAKVQGSAGSAKKPHPDVVIANPFD